MTQRVKFVPLCIPTFYRATYWQLQIKVERSRLKKLNSTIECEGMSFP